MVDIAAVRAAVQAQTPRTIELLQRIADPDRPMPDSDWTVGEAAAHLALVAEGYSDNARGLPPRYPMDVTDFAASSRRAFEAMPERDGAKLAEMLRSGVESFLEATDGLTADDPVRWHSDLQMPYATITSFLLSEQLLHGWDIARALDAPWDIPAEPARLILAAVVPFLAFIADPEAAAGVEAIYELDVAGGPRFYAVCRYGGLMIGPAPAGAVDCRLSTDPATWLLALWGRAPWPDLLDAGTIAVDGDAALARTFKSLLRNP